MWGGNQQGGSGDQFVFLTGLFATRTGKMAGAVAPGAFNTLVSLMKEAHAKGVDLVFIVSPPGANNTNPKMQGRLSVVVGTPRSQRQQQGFGSNSFFGDPPQQPQQQPQRAADTGGNIGERASMPPRDPLEQFLEEIG